MNYGFSIDENDTLSILHFQSNDIDEMGSVVADIVHSAYSTLEASHSKKFDSFNDLTQFVGDNNIIPISYDVDYNVHNDHIKLNYFQDISEALTKKLYYRGMTFYLTGFTNDNDRIYTSLDELHHKTIITAPADYDGALIGTVSDFVKPSDDDDTVRYFDSVTGIEETINL